MFQQHTAIINTNSWAFTVQLHDTEWQKTHARSHHKQAKMCEQFTWKMPLQLHDIYLHHFCLLCLWNNSESYTYG